MASGKKVLKWVGISLGSLLGILLLAAILIPLLVDVDKFRPQIVEVANQHINGKFELGKLKLSLWGQIKVQVDGFTLSDLQGRKVVSVNDVYFHVPFSSIFSGSPRLTFRMNEPEVSVIKDKKGINALTLMKAQPKATAPAPGEAEPPKTAGGSSLPGFVANARLGIEMRNARLAYTDKTTDLTSQVNDLNVRVKDLSLSRPTEMEISAALDTRMGKALMVRGPASITATAQPTFQGAEFQKAAVVLKVDMDKVEIQYGDLFHKKSGVPMNVDGSLTATMTSAQIENMVARFHNAEIKMHGGASGFGGATAPVLEFKMASNSIDLSPWAQLVPMLKQYELSGAAGIEAEAHGPTDKLQYQANLEVKALKAKAPMLKSQPEINAQVKVVTDKVERLSARMKAPGNNLSIDGTVISFTHPKVNFRVHSTEMDLDQLIEFPKPAPKKDEKAPPATAQTATAQTAGGKPGPAADFDAMLAPLRDNPIAAETDAKIVFALKFVKAMNVRMEPIEGQFTFKGLTASLDSFRMGVFDGKIASSAAFELKPKMPRYTFSMEVAGLDMKKAVTSQFEMFKNTVFGKASFQMKGKGASFNPDPAKVNLDAAGSLSILDAQFASLDVGRVATEAINKALVGLESKIPGVKGKQVKAPANSETGYERVTANFSIQKGIFSMPNFAAVSGKRKGIDIQGATVIGLVDYKLNADWQLIDTHDITGARGVTVDVNGVKIDPLLSEPGQPVRFPIKVTGTLFAPAPSYTSVPEALIKVALANVGRAAEAKVRAEVNARAQAEVKKLEQKAPPALKKAIEGLGKKFKF